MSHEQCAQMSADNAHGQTYPQYVEGTSPPAYTYMYNPVVHPPIPASFIIIQQPATSSRPVKYATKTSMETGIAQIILGVLSIIFQVVAIVIHRAGTYVSSGIWCGIFFVITGSFGVRAGKTKNRCLIVGHLVMCILAAVFAANQFSTSILDAIFSSGYTSHYSPSGGTIMLGLAMCIMLTLIALIEVVVAIIGSSISCRAVCCNNGNRVNMPVQYVHQQPHAVMAYATSTNPVHTVTMPPPPSQQGSSTMPHVSDNHIPENPKNQHVTII